MCLRFQYKVHNLCCVYLSVVLWWEALHWSRFLHLLLFPFLNHPPACFCAHSAQSELYTMLWTKLQGGQNDPLEPEKEEELFIAVLTMVLFITQFICRAVKFNYFWSALHVFPHFQLTNVTFSGFNMFTLNRIISQTILNNVFALIIMLKLTGCHSNRHRSACWVIRLCVWTIGDYTDTFIRCHAISAERTNLTVELQITRAHLAQFTLISPRKWSQITW